MSMEQDIVSIVLDVSKKYDIPLFESFTIFKSIYAALEWEDEDEAESFRWFEKQFNNIIEKK